MLLRPAVGLLLHHQICWLHDGLCRQLDRDLRRLLTPQCVTLHVQGVDTYNLSGCFTDGQAARGLSNFTTAPSTSMTVESCVSSCQTRGYGRADVEYGSECYCGNTLATTSTPAPISDRVPHGVYKACISLQLFDLRARPEVWKTGKRTNTGVNDHCPYVLPYWSAYHLCWMTCGSVLWCPRMVPFDFRALQSEQGE